MGSVMTVKPLGRTSRSMVRVGSGMLCRV
jgi:hypothetical protein